MYLWKFSLQSIKVFGVANACNYVFPLRIDKKITVWFAFASGGIACETNSRTRIIVSISENHCLDIYCRS